MKFHKGVQLRPGGGGVLDPGDLAGDPTTKAAAGGDLTGDSTTKLIRRRRRSRQLSPFAAGGEVDN